MPIKIRKLKTKSQKRIRTLKKMRQNLKKNYLPWKQMNKSCVLLLRNNVENTFSTNFYEDIGYFVQIKRQFRTHNQASVRISSDLEQI